MAVQDRRLWITTGYGLEAVLPDGRIGEIRDRDVIPLFRSNRYGEGILRGAEALARVILAQEQDGSSRRPQARLPARYQERRRSGATGVLLGLFILLILFSVALSAMDRTPGIGTRDRRRRRGFWGPGWAGTGSGGAVGGWSGGGFSAGSFGGFGGGSTGGGGAGGSW